jgi:hypothetical protein
MMVSIKTSKIKSSGSTNRKYIKKIIIKEKNKKLSTYKIFPISFLTNPFFNVVYENNNNSSS